MLRSLAVATVLTGLTGLPGLAQQADTPAPVPAPAPGVQTVPGASDANLPADPKLIVPARKSNCSSARQVMS